MGKINVTQRVSPSLIKEYNKIMDVRYSNGLDKKPREIKMPTFTKVMTRHNGFKEFLKEFSCLDQKKIKELSR